MQNPTNAGGTNAATAGGVPTAVNNGTLYSIRMPARALSAVTANTERPRFLVGSLAMKQENEMHMLDFDEESLELTAAIYRHSAGEIWQIVPSPSRHDTCFTLHSKLHADMGTTQAATLWRIPAGNSAGATGTATAGGTTSTSTAIPSAGTGSRKISQPLEPILTLEAMDVPIRSILWSRSEQDCVLAIDENAIHVWKLGSGWSQAEKPSTFQVPGNKGQVKFNAATWNPHNAHDIVVSSETSFRGWDLRSGKQTYCVEQAHGMYVRDMDFNPNKPHILASTGDDCRIRFWDVRNSKGPLKELQPHTHWVWSVAYNQFHDQLLLSAGSDAQVMLHNVPSLSSAPHTFSSSTSDDPTSPTKKLKEYNLHFWRNIHLVPIPSILPFDRKPMDSVLATFEQHEESVYAVTWSTADPWVFASLSYDGRVVISTVPNEEKYKIIL